MLLIALTSVMSGATYPPVAALPHFAARTGSTNKRPDGTSKRENAFLAAVTPLLDVTGRVLTKEEVARSLNVDLSVLRDLGPDGITYAGDNSINGWRAEFFTASDRFNVSVSFRGFAGDKGNVRLDSLAAELVARGWTHNATVTHPFLIETFTSNCRNIRVEHDGARVIVFELLNVC